MRPFKSEFRHPVPLLGLALLTLPLVVACAGQEAAEAPTTSAVYYHNAALIDGNGQAISNAAFVVENGVFTAAGPAGDVAVPEGATRVDLAGKTVMPAIVNAHVHVGGNTADEIVGQLEHYAYYGVGSVLSMGLDSSAATIQVRDQIAPNAARYRVAGRGITAPEPGRTEVPHWVTNEAEARAAVQAEVAKNVDYIKIWVDDRNGQYQKLPANLRTAIIDEAHKANKRVAAHIYSLADAKQLLEAGIDAFAHGVRDMDIDTAGVRLFRARGPGFYYIPNMPGRGVPTDLAWISGTIPPAELQELQAEQTEDAEAAARWEIQARNLELLNREDINVAFGTDGGVPWQAHVEIEDMVAAGLTPLEAISSATRIAAEAMQLTDVGTVEAGKSADFVVLDANPAADITNTRRINAVYLRGELVDRAGIAARLTAPTVAAAAP